MKNIIATLVLTLSSSAFACPNLAGTFSCKIRGKTETVTIEQDTKAGITIYTINGMESPADNLEHNVPDNEMLRNGVQRSWCDDDVTLKSQLKGKVFQNGTFVGDLNANIESSLPNGALKEVITGEIKGPFGRMPINETVSCSKR